jgi:hypothetical protein
MRRQSLMRSLVVAGLLGMGLTTLGSTPARASGTCEPVYHYVLVTTYVDRQVAYTKVVTLYDHCGRPYKVATTCYQTVKVPVTRRILVCD